MTVPLDTNFRIDDLAKSMNLLNELSTIVKNEESTLSGGKKLGVGTLALQKLLETKVSFGNPQSQLKKILPEELTVESEKMNVGIRNDHAKGFNYYYLVLPVLMQPGRGISFRRLECKVDFSPKGETEPIVHSIFPTPQWHDVLRWGGQMRLRLDGNLKWIANILHPQNTAQTSVAPSFGGLTINDKFSPFIEVPEYSFSVGRADIVATGVGSSWCFWRVEKPVLVDIQTINFGIVFKVPRGRKSLKMTGLVVVEPNFEWLANSLRDVLDYLEQKWKLFFETNEDSHQGYERLPIGSHEVWDIKLPEK